MDRKVFVQIGAARDGLDPYLAAAHCRGLEAWLIDTPEYLAYRDQIPGLRPFDRQIAVDLPSDPRRVAEALGPFLPRVRLALAGFDRYTAAALHLDGQLREGGRP